MVKTAKPKAKKVAKSTATSSSSSSSSSASSASSNLLECSPPTQKNGANRPGVAILTSEEQKAYSKHSIEVKQIAGLVILKCRLGIAESPAQSQILPDENFSKTFKLVYEALCKNVSIGKRVAAVPLIFLNIGTSKAKEIMTGTKMRKKYSVMKSYMNNTLSVL